TETELVPHLHYFAVAEMDFDEFGATHGLAVLVLECGGDAPGAHINHVGRVAPGVTTVEAERHPAVAALSQINMAGFFGRHLGSVKHEQLFALLIADPEFLFVRCERGAVCAMRNRLAAGQYPMRHFAGLQVGDIEPDVFAEADVSVAVPAVDRERKHAALADVADVADE